MEFSSGNIRKPKIYKSAIIALKTQVEKPSIKSDRDSVISQTLTKNSKVSDRLLKHRSQKSFSPGYTFSKIARFECDIYEKYKSIS